MSNWNMETGYNESIALPYPMRVFGTGKQFSVNVLLRIHNSDIDALCGGSTQGFKVIFHAPMEDPQISKRYFQVSPGKQALFSISPNLIRTCDGLKKYSPDARQCYLEHERKLQFYNHYTKRNCESECLANFTLNTCGCAIFTMPSKRNFSSFIIVYLYFSIKNGDDDVLLCRAKRQPDLWSSENRVL